MTKEAELRYMLLIYHDERQVREEMSEDERRAMTTEYFVMDERLREAGAFVHAEPLEPTASATTVRMRDGQSVVTRGPAVETAQQLNGYYLIEAASEEEARRWAERVPAARIGSVEVRPLCQVPAGVPGEEAAER
jgi:hypothetical protein